MMRLSRQLERLKVQKPPVFVPTPSTDPRVVELKGRIEKLIEYKQTSKGKLKSQKPKSTGEIGSECPNGLRIHEHLLSKEHRHGKTGLLGGINPPSEILAKLCDDEDLKSLDTSRLLFLDTETTGLSGGAGTLAFLIGLAWYEDGSLKLEQLMLGNPSQEYQQLECLKKRIEQASGIVTYNGRRFDWPLLCNRFVLNRMAPPAIEFHIDLLKPARALYKRRLGSVRLVNIETEVLGFERIGDIDGSEIPARYWEFIRSSEESLIDPILEHNLNDLIAMAAMLDRFVWEYQTPSSSFPQDQMGVAKLAMKSGDTEYALTKLQELVESGPLNLQCEAAILLAKRKQKLTEFTDAVDILESVLCEERIDEYPELALALAKLYEHKIKDLDTALFYAKYTSELEGGQAHERRVLRLNRRINRQALKD